jgi:ATP phosphoribosyltransferase
VIRIALPKGRLMETTAAVLKQAGWELPGYYDGMRVYKIKSGRFPELFIKVIHEEDIPVQVAIGNYDLGITSRDWTEELLVKYSQSAVILLKELGYGDGALYAAAYAHGGVKNLKQLAESPGAVRLASEYPNLAEHLAAGLRLRRFRIFPLWGGPEAYPPEHAEVVLIVRKSEDELAECGLKSLGKILDCKACLIANKNSWEKADLAEVIHSICDNLPSPGFDTGSAIRKTAALQYPPDNSWSNVPPDVVRFALPDGHQQAHVKRILDAANVPVKDYPSETNNRRPASGLPSVIIKVIRPQDMLVQVAGGYFDLAVTGRDWLRDHLYQFPSSPVKELLDLKYGRVRIVAVVANDVPAKDIKEFRQHCAALNTRVRVATEYTNIADMYARLNRLGNYRVIPTWGATEAFLPEDADLLIENTETGTTIAKNNLKIIDTLFESTACLVGSATLVENAVKRQRIDNIVRLLNKGVEEIQLAGH